MVVMEFVMDNFIYYIEQLLRAYDSNFEQVKISLVKNLSDYDSIVVSSPMTVYRPKVDNALFARIKAKGKKPYISFRKKYIVWFIDHQIEAYFIKSDQEYFRVSLDDFQVVIENNDFAELAVQICLDAMNFPKFGCCNKFKECSDVKKCLHSDLLYSTACMYRKNLENNRIFYGKNKNV